MKTIQLTVNGRLVNDSVEPRQHLADFLRERLNLTATHLRCEQGACGACTLLIDGQPARACITQSVLCDGAEITTLEGLEDDAIMVALRRAFSVEHGLQCGYCTPGMLITARDIVLRLPDADLARIRLELIGNLCRCTGYAGIVRAISRLLEERRRGELGELAPQSAPIGPVGARPASRRSAAETPTLKATRSGDVEAIEAKSVLGLNGRQPNFEIQHSFTIARPPDEVWAFFSDIERLVPCMPGASLSQPPVGNDVEGKMSVKLGPISTSFEGQAHITRDDGRRRGKIVGAGLDQLGGSRAAGEVEYALEPMEAEGTRVALTIRALLIGPLAQFGRSGIVEDLIARIADTFARNLEARLAGAAFDVGSGAQTQLNVSGLIWQVVLARLKRFLGRILGRPKS